MLKLLNRSFNLLNIKRNGIRYCTTKLQGPVIGIDLGTTNSCVAVMEGTEARVIANAEGARTTPSIVAFTDKNEVLVGDPARRQAITNSENTLYATKRYIGRSFQDKEVQKDLKILPYKVVSKNNDCWFRVRDKEYSPSQIAGFILTKMKSTAESYLGMKVKNIVVTVPAYFNEAQRSATKDAGTIAGLNVARIINEPTAAALAYGLNKANDNKTIAVYDLGGGTFDISILEMAEGVCEVKSTNGDTHLGGEDFDNIIVDFLCNDFKSKFGTDAKQDRMALQRIREAGEKAKTELSFSTSTQINLPYLIGANSYQTTFTRSKLELLVNDLIERTTEPCRIALKDSGLQLNDINEVLLVGGMTRMPKVQEKVKSFFGKEPTKSVNPDEAVAMGAAIQGGVLTGSVTDLVLVDVTSLSLGVNTVGNRHAVIISKNTAVPVRKTQVFTTSADNQESVDIEVFQGERLLSFENTRLGQFVLSGIPRMPRGIPKIEVCFDLDNNGLLDVTAKELSSGVSAKTTLKENPGGLSKEQLEKMAKDAEVHLEADRKRVEAIDKKQRLDSVIFELERLMNENDNLIDSELKESTKSLITEGRPMLDENYSDLSNMTTTTGRLEDNLMKMKSMVSSKTTEKATEKSTANQDVDNTKSDQNDVPKN